MYLNILKSIKLKLYRKINRRSVNKSPSAIADSSVKDIELLIKKKKKIMEKHKAVISTNLLPSINMFTREVSKKKRKYTKLTTRC